MDNEVKCWCKHCGIELPPSHTGPCPKCGKSGKRCEATATAAIGIKASMSTTHKLKWSGESLTIFSLFAAVFLAIAIWGIQLLPFSPVVNYGILLCLLLVMVGVLWWKRYSVLMLIRRLESKMGGEKTV